MEYEEKKHLPYMKKPTKELLAIVNHEVDHDCRCYDPDDSCQPCYMAWEELRKRDIDTGHYYD